MSSRSSAAALVLVGWALAGGLPAADPDPEPLYVIHGGRRVPTRILPAAPRPADARPAALDVVAAEPAPPPDLLEEDVELELEPPPPYRYTIRHYAGYPVAVPGWGYGYSYPPRDFGTTLGNIYETQRRLEQRERERRFNFRDMRQRKGRVLASFEKALRLGLDHLHNGDYGQAVIALQMATELNQGDPAARIHLAQARLAQGHFAEAGQVLRRGLQLQPRLAYVALDLRRYYGDPAEFDRHVDALAAALKRSGGSADAWFLLGYLEFQRDRLEPAHHAFRVSARGLPRDELTASYLQVTRPPAR